MNNCYFFYFFDHTINYRYNKFLSWSGMESATLPLKYWCLNKNSN